MRGLPSLLCAAALLAGCATPEQMAARQAAEAQAQEQRNQAYTAALAAQCEAIGYVRGTDPWRSCLLQLHGQAQQQMASDRATLLQEALRRQYQSLPPCSSLPPGTSGYARSQGSCR